MNKMYIKPIVETEGLEITGQTLCASTQFGGSTDGLGSGEDITND